MAKTVKGRVGWAVVKKLLKAIPIIGPVFAVGFAGHEIKKKGLAPGAVHVGLDVIPVEGRGEVSMVNHTVVEELLQDICQLSFHHHTAATANLALWRSRGDHHAFVGEFAYQLRFKDPADIRPESLAACEAFFIELQQIAADWLALTTTKTGAVYRLKGNPPQAHE